MSVWRAVERGAWTDDDRLLIGDIANQVGITIEQLAHQQQIRFAALLLPYHALAFPRPSRTANQPAASARLIV